MMNVGDVVSLKSGGPKMTVTQVNSDLETVECAWVREDGSVEFAWFLSSVLAYGPW
jgi:uncharacterized protein YodC (DUF2158 family)